MRTWVEAEHARIEEIAHCKLLDVHAEAAATLRERGPPFTTEANRSWHHGKVLQLVLWYEEAYKRVWQAVKGCGSGISMPNAPMLLPPPLPGGRWPHALHKWVERALKACKSEAECKRVERSMAERIDRAELEGRLWLIDWEQEPLPDRHTPQ